MGFHIMEDELSGQVTGGSQGTVSKYKIVLVGDAFVGKTCLINRFIYDTFDMSYQVTVGIDFLSKTLYVDDRTVKLHLWDTAGQERFRSLIPHYVTDSAAAIVVYDITNRASFGSVRQWIMDLKQTAQENVKLMIVGNKVDLEDKRQVSKEEGEKLAQELGLMFFETSAKEGTNVNELFNKLASVLPGMEGSEFPQNIGGINLVGSPPPAADKKNCCR
eukprot:TRINITY_DN7295_c0_g1_i9.p2 TRINITY_DN7295_c0_g1~~TRINITY_DN7295_c0_g1_i9.p2  ORF type:complete len:218 (-),score=83.25 TRINITY_DN7295_c0_g1_i9:79-732(-)